MLNLLFSSRRILTSSYWHRAYVSAASASPKLNLPIDYAKTSILHHSASTVRKALGIPVNSDFRRINLFQAVNAALRDALSADEKVLLFGEDVAFGGVFRCSMDLATEFGAERVFNTPLSEQGIVGFAIGCAAEGMKPVAEIQFADYVFPAFDQLVNEAAKFRYREGSNDVHFGGLVVRMPCGSIGHGGLYHSQSPESLFAHVPGLRVVMPRSPSQAKGLLTQAILHNNDPVLFMEPKVLYRAAVEYVPSSSYSIPLGKADVIKPGRSLTVVSYGQPLYLCSEAISAIEKEVKGAEIELIDLRSIYPWDKETVVGSAEKTGRVVVVHESMTNLGIGAELAATVQEEAFLKLEAPIARVAGWATHPGFSFDKFNMPDIARIYDAIKRTLNY